MNKRIAVRLLKAAHNKVGIKEVNTWDNIYVCIILQKLPHHYDIKPSTIKEYNLTLTNLLKCIEAQLEDDTNNLRGYISSYHPTIPRSDCDMVKIRKAWILAMIEHIQKGKTPDNKFLTKFLNSLNKE